MAAAAADRTGVYVTVPTPAGADPVGNLLARDCQRMYRVEWQRTVRHPDGRRRVLEFRAPDIESVRVVLRSAGIPWDAISNRRPAAADPLTPDGIHPQASADSGL